jgi:DNA-binding response OmpR family regulator
VLAVDDEAVNLIVLEAALTPLGYRVEAAENAAEAMQAMQEQKPDLVLLDVMMPGQTGIELCEIMRRSPVLADVPVVLVTALAAESTRSTGLAAGADDYLEKPIDIEELIYRVRSIVGRTQWSSNPASEHPVSTGSEGEPQPLAPTACGSTAMGIGLEAMVHETAAAIGGGDQGDALAAAMARAAGLSPCGSCAT